MLTKQQRTVSILIFVVHATVALIYKVVFGLTMLAYDAPFGAYWHNLPDEYLKLGELPRSMWYLHAQPPLYNLFGAIFVNLFDNYELPLHLTNILLGAIIAVLVYWILLSLIQRDRLSAALGVLFSLDISLFLYEVLVFYELLTLFFVVLSVWLLVRYQQTGHHRYAVGVIVATNALVLLRPTYTALYLGLVVVGLVVVYPALRTRRFGWLATAISVPTIAWHIKNLLVFGVVGTSSFTGVNLWRSAVTTPSLQVQTLVAEGKLDPMFAEIRPFDALENYAAYGYDESSEIGVLNYGGSNNINMIDIGRDYQAATVTVVKHYPVMVLKRQVYAAYLFTKTPATFKEFTFVEDRDKIAAHDFVQTDLLMGRLFFEPLEKASGIATLNTDDSSFTFLTFAFPLALGWYFYERGRHNRFAAARWLATIRHEPILSFIMLIILYTTVVSILGETGENMRFFFAIQHLFWIVLTYLLTRKYRPATQAAAPNASGLGNLND